MHTGSWSIAGSFQRHDICASSYQTFISLQFLLFGFTCLWAYRVPINCGSGIKKRLAKCEVENDVSETDSPRLMLWGISPFRTKDLGGLLYRWTENATCWKLDGIRSNERFSLLRVQIYPISPWGLQWARLDPHRLMLLLLCRHLFRRVLNGVETYEWLSQCCFKLTFWVCGKFY